MATTGIYTLSLHDALPISQSGWRSSGRRPAGLTQDGLLHPEAAARDHPDAARGGGVDLLFVARGPGGRGRGALRSEEHTSELQSRRDLVCRLLLEKKNKQE